MFDPVLDRLQLQILPKDVEVEFGEKTLKSNLAYFESIISSIDPLFHYPLKVAINLSGVVAGSGRFVRRFPPCTATY